MEFLIVFEFLHKYSLFIGSLERSDRTESGISRTFKSIFSKVRLVPDSTRSDISKEPIKSGYLCKNENKIRNSVTTGPKCKVHYIHLIETTYTIR